MNFAGVRALKQKFGNHFQLFMIHLCLGGYINIHVHASFVFIKLILRLNFAAMANKHRTQCIRFTNFEFKAKSPLTSNVYQQVCFQLPLVHSNSLDTQQEGRYP